MATKSNAKQAQPSAKSNAKQVETIAKAAPLAKPKARRIPKCERL